MGKKLFTRLPLIILAVMLVMTVGSAAAVKNITAQETYDMVKGGEATLIDVRTLAEAAWVGSPALVAGGDPIAYLIPWMNWKGVDENGRSIMLMNPDFDALIEQTFGDDKNQTLIFMCLCGGRSLRAANRLESLGYTNVYNLDNPLKGCRGGFLGSNYGVTYDGYGGYPGRLPSNGLPQITVQTDTDKINNPDDSVSWMDTGLPITRKIDPAKIPQLLTSSN